MIYDSLDQLSRYTGLSRSLDAAVKAITSADLFALPAGRHELVPDMVYAVVSQIETKPLACLLYTSLVRNFMINRLSLVLYSFLSFSLKIPRTP